MHLRLVGAGCSPIAHTRDVGSNGQSAASVAEAPGIPQTAARPSADRVSSDGDAHPDRPSSRRIAPGARALLRGNPRCWRPGARGHDAIRSPTCWALAAVPAGYRRDPQVGPGRLRWRTGCCTGIGKARVPIPELLGARLFGAVGPAHPDQAVFAVAGVVLASMPGGEASAVGGARPVANVEVAARADGEGTWCEPAPTRNGNG